MVQNVLVRIVFIMFQKYILFIFSFCNKTNMSSRVRERTSKRAKTAEYDVNNPFYICVAYDELSPQQQASLPPDIQRKVM